MALFVQTFQAALPLNLFDRLQRVRNRYAKALVSAAAGDYSQATQLRAVSRYLGHLLAQEARKSPDERGGIRLMDLSLALDRFFPEMRGWNQYETLQRVANMHAAALGNIVPSARERAS